LSAPVCLSVCHFRAVVQIKDAVRDGLRAVKNVIDDKAVVLGAGAFEVAAAQHLRETVKKQVRRQRVAGLKDTSSRGLVGL
jgi:T-complex protein 1 subunit zeta